MEQNPQSMELSPQTPETRPMSLLARLINVFVAPGETFEAIKRTEQSSANWIVPALLLVVVSWIGLSLVLSQETIRQQLKDAAAQAVQKQVERHRMSPDEAERQVGMAEKFADLGAKIGGAVVPVFIGFAVPFIWGLFLWLLGAKAFRGSLTYMKAVEIVGLANMVAVLGAIVQTLLILAMGNIYASPGLMLLIKGFDPQNTVHGLLSAVNAITIWVLAVRAIGLSRLSGASLRAALACVFGIWVAYMGFFTGLGLLLKAVFGKMGAA